MVLIPCLRDEHRDEFTQALTQPRSSKSSREVFDTVCECVGVVTGVNNIKTSKTRLRHISRARQYVIWIMLAEMRGVITYVELGQLFTHSFNHATIVHAKRAVDDLLAVDHDTREMFKHLAQMLAAYGYERCTYQLEKINIIR